MGARQFVVQDALETTIISGLYVSWLMPITKVGVTSSLAGAVTITFFAACPDVRHGLFCGAESAGGVDDVLGSALSPWDQRGVALRVYRDLLSVIDAFPFSYVPGFPESGEYGIISDHIYHIL